ncbi:MAG TPA: GGDEF domain-containing protein [Candidatus Limnocylindrales bacterium]|nr:GGDEF domain-containing protein [Candidatus Limnocylindrales bacterium]
MDALSLGPSRSTSGTPDTGSPIYGIKARLVAWLAALDGRPGSDGPSGDVVAAAVSRRAILLGFTAAEIVLGLGLLALVSVAVPIASTIASPALAGTALAGSTGGVLLWTLFGLLGSVRTVSSPDGPGHFTFHLPFVGAAMILGGPTAGAWVAILATTDRRELRSQPWYGVLANHASIAIAAVAGGIAYAVLRDGLAGATGDEGFATFVAIVASGVVLEGVANGLAIVTIKIRDGMTWPGVLGIVVDDFRSETLLEIALIWILVIAFATVGWWAPIVIAVSVVAYVARAGREDVDLLTQMVRKQTFLDKVERKIGWMRLGMLSGGTMVMVDLNDFHEFNNRYSYDVGDEVIRAVGARLTHVFPRHEDIRSRLMGDEFAIFLVGLIDRVKAEEKANELLNALTTPVVTSVGVHRIGAAIGVVVTPAAGISTPSAAAIFHRAEVAVKLAKAHGQAGGIHVSSSGDPDAVSRTRGDNGEGTGRGR